jgi:hypothetical protein
VKGPIQIQLNRFARAGVWTSFVVQVNHGDHIASAVGARPAFLDTVLASIPALGPRDVLGDNVFAIECF